MTAAGTTARVAAHARWESALLLRNGEQLLLTIVIPVAILLVMTQTSLLAQPSGTDRLATALATALTVSVIGAGFTSLAIATGFERRSGALRFLSTTPLTRGNLLAGKLLATAIVTVLASAGTTLAALAVGWRAAPGAAWAVPEIALGLAAFAAWGMALAGLLRAEAVLAVANAVFLALIMFGGVIVPAAQLPGPLATAAPLLPSGALYDLLVGALAHGAAPSASAIGVLVAWLTVGSLVAVRTFRWS